MSINSDYASGPYSNCGGSCSNCSLQTPFNNPYLSDFSSARWHSNQAGDDIIETIDISQSTYKDSQGNTQHVLQEFDSNFLSFTNCSDVNVTIENLTIIRAYQMQSLSADLSDNGCNKGKTYLTQPDFATRQDYPCNYENCGGASLTSFDSNNYWKIVSPGQTITWNWNNPENPENNYLGPISCLFNFNNVVLNVVPNANGYGPCATSGDEKFSIKVNNSDWVDFYQTGVGGHYTAPSVDLVKVFPGPNGYNDAPGAGNSLQLTLDPEATYSLALCDGCGSDSCNVPTPGCCPSLGVDCPSCYSSCGGYGGNINIYRVYQTKNVYPITISYSTGGSIVDSNNNLVSSGEIIGVNAGDTPMFTMMPNYGYQLSGLLLNGTWVAPVTYFTFQAVQGSQNIYAELHS